MKFGRSRGQCLVCAELAEVPHRTDQVVRCYLTTVPMTLASHLLGIIDNLNQNTLKQQPNDRLPLVLPAGFPNSRQVTCEVTNHIDLVRR
jgi:hypothetical protein